MLLALRINVLAKGYSGVSMETAQAMVEAFNASCLSWVPEKGTVGASGDLAPLAHLALGLMGEGRMWSPRSGWADAKSVLEGHGLTPISLRPKEGLALINGTQMISSLGAEAVERAQAVARQADIIAALTLETLRGTNKAFDSYIHSVRPHPCQMVARRFRSVLRSDIFPSEISGEWFTVSCSDLSQSIRWLATEALGRYAKAYPDRGGVGGVARFTVKRRLDGWSLYLDDPIKDVLEGNDFIELEIDGDHWTDSDESGSSGRGKTSSKEPKEYISLDGNSLTTADLVGLGQGLFKIKFTPQAEKRVRQARDLIETIIKEKRVVYGINTGFGKFAETVVPHDQLKELQENLIRSHSAGVGPPLSPVRTRMLLALRINVLAKGYSGVSMETAQAMVEAFNASCLSWVPEKGTVGASGDLAPLAHLALGLMGEGRMWSPRSGWADAKSVLEGHGLTPISLRPKEGLALINGTQMISSLGAEAVERAQAVARQADIIAALTLETLKGTNKAFDSDIHAVRPHPGQIEVARRFRSVLHSDVFPSEISERSCDRVQDAYTLRCCPQVHGVANDTIAFVKSVLTTELNSATDNPLVFAERGITISGGNFHGEYPAKALDFLSIGVHELACISERRIERLCNPSLSELPAFLVREGGLNSGFMIAHCTAAALVSENKVLCHPSSVDSLSTSAATEDHVSMGGWGARKALRVVEHVEQVLAIELLAACQALEFHRPLKTTPPLERVYELVRSVVRPWDKDRLMSPDIEAAHKLLLEEKVWEAVQPYMEQYRERHRSDTAL